MRCLIKAPSQWDSALGYHIFSRLPRAFVPAAAQGGGSAGIELIAEPYNGADEVVPARMGAEPPPDLKHGVLHGVEAVVGRRAPNGLIDLLFCDRNVRVGIEQVEDTKLLFRQGDCCLLYTSDAADE